ncbi:MAG: glycoside hydrolase family 15 protein [Firmicutes bacterium]|nr:glycoside hydrolase family 15 protein [Bacillota bacterium]
MPREIVIGNGNLLINFDPDLNMRDLYFPYVGMENHIAGHKSAAGIWVDGHLSWLEDPGWQRVKKYRKESLVSDVTARNTGIGLELSISDAVHHRKNIYIKKVNIRNLAPHQREVRLIFNNDLSIGGSDVGDTALFDPGTGAVYHYKRDYYFLFNGRAGGEGFFQYTTGIKRFGDQEGTWRDAEDGYLEGNPVAQGSVDSTVSFRVELPPGGEKDIYYWIVIGRSFDEIRRGNNFVLESTPGALIEETEIYWRNWVNKSLIDFRDLSARVADLYKTSLLIIRTQIDNRGAVLAANDTDIMVTNRDHYSYLWPRDGALVAYAMDRAGYPEITVPFYRFCEKALTEEGFLWPKYHPDGTVGSSWHPWVKNGEIQLPVQEDETALVLWALGEYYHKNRDVEFVKSLYEPLIKRAAGFLYAYRDPVAGLPLESYDLWEERRGVFTFTSSAVYGGLKAAENFARLFGDRENSRKWGRAAGEVKEGIIKYLYSKELGRFLRGVYFEPGGAMVNDLTLESSLFGIFEFGVLPANDPRVGGTMLAIRDGLRVNTEVGGVARYTGDYYFRRSDDILNVPGNPWFICTLWLAEWYIATAGRREDLGAARAILEWAAAYSMESNVLSEQIHPYTGEPLSVAPLTWSHSTFVLTVVKYLEKMAELEDANEVSGTG